MSGTGPQGHIEFMTEGDDVVALIDSEAYRGGPQFRIAFADGPFDCAVICTPQMACDLAVAALAFAKRHGVTP